MKIVVPSEEVSSEVDARVLKTARSVRLNGFRPGKVPQREVRRRFGEGLRQEVAAELMQSSLTAAIAEKDVNPAGMPRIDSVSLEAGEDLEFEAVLRCFR